MSSATFALPVPPRRWRRGRAEKIAPYSYIAPFFMLFLVFGLGPLIYTVWVSFHHWEPLQTDHEFVGLQNYRVMLEDPRFWQAIRNTFSIFALSTIPGLVLSLILASLLKDRRLKVKTFWRMALLVPNITPLVTVSLVFASVFGRDYGPVAWLLKSLHLPAIGWDVHPFTTHLVIALMVMWRWTGYNALIYLAAMQAIPVSLYEAAEIDGATRWQTFTNVTLPMIRPTILFTVVVASVGGLQIFAEPLLFTDPRGGNNGQGLTMTLLVYSQAFGSLHFGYAATIAVALLFIIITVALVNLLLVRLIRSA
jgi:cellobiose transport system permease protein